MKTLMITLLIVLVFGQVVAQDRALIQDEAAQQAWREDVDSLLEKLVDRHPNPYFRFSEAEFQAEVDNLKAEIPYMTDNQIILEMARITGMLDGHTHLFMLDPSVNFHLYPLRL